MFARSHAIEKKKEEEEEKEKEELVWEVRSPSKLVWEMRSPLKRPVAADWVLGFPPLFFFFFFVLHSCYSSHLLLLFYMYKKLADSFPLLPGLELGDVFLDLLVQGHHRRVFGLRGKVPVEVAHVIEPLGTFPAPREVQHDLVAGFAAREVPIL